MNVEYGFFISPNKIGYEIQILKSAIAAGNWMDEL
jgi:hypothetical protein